MGVSIEEAAEDLKMRPAQLENIEAGNVEVFKDIFYLKYFIRDYAKYLGLDYEDMVDEFNEYLFDYTSKISLEDIKKAKGQKVQKEVEEDTKIHSPYTVEPKKGFSLTKAILLTIFLVMIGLIIFFTWNYFHSKDRPENQIETLSILEIR